MLTDKDLSLINQKGISKAQVEKQLEQFKEGFPPLELVRPATPGDGIVEMPEDKALEYASLYRQKAAGISTCKFTPASGAASRMFKDLYAFRDCYARRSPEDTSFSEGKGDKYAYTFFTRLDEFAFYEDLEEVCEKQGIELVRAFDQNTFVEVLDLFLGEKGLNYGQKPKGLLTFHRYDFERRTAFEEHLVEAAHYAKSVEGKVSLHFTVSPEHMDGFRELCKKVAGRYEQRYGASYDISYSVQKPETDTLAVTPDNNPFRLDNGELLFRPGGHGALLENLNELEAELIFIKNIDNVCLDTYKETTYLYKMALAGLLLEKQEQAARLYQRLNAGKYTDKELDGAKKLVLNDFCTEYDQLPTEREALAGWLKAKLMRPIRICGMVRNEGEPGGGPFWARMHDGSASLQIVEKSQIDTDDPEQMKVLQSSTHFNPVDIVCWTGKPDGSGKFDLRQYTDPATGFIANKTKDGRELKALELPGLWNGAMSDWNTLFAEVPLITFNPVKTVNDLLKKGHNSEAFCEINT